MLFYPFQLLLPQKHPGAQGAQVGGPRPAWGLQAKGRNPWNLWGCDSDFARIFTHLHHDLRGKTHEILGFMSISPEFEQGSKRGNKLETSEKCWFCQGLARMYAKNPCEQHLNVCERNILWWFLQDSNGHRYENTWDLRLLIWGKVEHTWPTCCFGH